jgi:hypothetical protein
MFLNSSHLLLSCSREYVIKRLCTYGGRTVCADHTFQTMKAVRQVHEQRFEALHSFMNEHGQICSSIFVESTSLQEVLKQARLFFEPCLELGIPVRHPDMLHIPVEWCKLQHLQAKAPSIKAALPPHNFYHSNR